MTSGEWMARRRSELASVRPVVDEIIAQVRERGDAALVDLTRKFDGVTLDRLQVSEEEREAAYDQVDRRLLEALLESEARISRFHELQLPRDLWLAQVEPGITLGVKTAPLARVGAYIPGGRAAYPSTALMCAIPARVAGVGSLCCCSPPPIPPLSLVAMDIAGYDEIFKIGGAQAIAAMAIGTESVRAVDKIVGPGNVYVTMAKMLLRDRAEIDFPAGPSEILVIADETARPEFIAADILAQAEHDPGAACLLITPDASLPARVGASLELQVKDAARKEVIREAMEHSGFLVVDTLGRAVEEANRAAPEHLSLQVRDPMEILPEITHAGSIFIGPYAAVACGDYASGTNHVLPTAGYAGVYSGLDVGHFLTRSSVQIISREGLEAIGDTIEALAEAEGLEAHARSIHLRRT